MVQSHQITVWRYLRYLGCDPASADDLLQETFLAVHRKPFEERTPEATLVYLRTVARNLYLMSLRRARRQAIVGNLDLIEEVWQQYAADDGQATTRPGTSRRTAIELSLWKWPPKPDW